MQMQGAIGKESAGGHMSMCKPMEAGKEATGGWVLMREHRETRERALEGITGCRRKKGAVCVHERLVGRLT